MFLSMKTCAGRPQALLRGLRGEKERRRRSSERQPASKRVNRDIPFTRHECAVALKSTAQTLKPLGRRAVTCRAALGTSLGTSEAHSKLKGLEVLAGVDGAPVQLVEQWGPEDTVVVAWLRSFG
ncbi:hypothetical protein CYMTET_16274 [Cymbomonas tetramitiformis]|uniref:Uncharacterized protein n=1 Tax=Cymbomonas tetramitiformis TaxID=36881 RepID=A0AAE0GCP1_9CHLO|nr:hypothetical protein CYMTET_16274 [Cymbomonas tetramitiformis]